MSSRVINHSEPVAGLQEVDLDTHPEDHGAKRAHSVAVPAIEGTDQPSGADRIERERITPPPAEAAAVSKVAASVGIGAIVIKLALAREEAGNRKLQALAAQAKELLGDIDLLLAISSELTALPDQDSHTVSDTMKNHFEKLKAHDIHHEIERR